MNYLFFDIECANCFGGSGKICSFGYVLTNSKFAILKQEDIIMNPKSKFNLRSPDGKFGIELSYSEAQFLAAPSFDFFYPMIASILTAPDQICFGHSVGNDINFINSDTKRYDLPYVEIKAYDTQLLYKVIKKAANEAGLEKICKLYGINAEAMHRSDYDAFLTMHILSNLCKEQSVDVEGLLEMCPNAYYTSKDGRLEGHLVTVSSSKQLLSAATHFRPYEYLRIKKANAIDLKAILHEACEHKDIEFFGQNNIDVKYYLRNPEVLVQAEAQDSMLTIEKFAENVWGKCFCFNLNFESEHYKKCLYLVRRIRLLGGYYCNKLAKADYFLATETPCARQTQHEKKCGIDGNPQGVSEQELCDILGLKFESYNESDMLSITKIKNITSF